MRTSKVLEMLNQGRIEELKAALRDELYSEALKNKPGAAKRYSAMKKYFTYIKPVREPLQKPALITFENKNYISFCNAHSLVLTVEPCGEIELYTGDRYPDVTKLIRFGKDKKTVDFTKVFADAKAKGYKLKKSEVEGSKFQYLMQYDGAYFKLGLLEATFGIIDDGELVTVYHDENDPHAPITIKNGLGVCMIMPMRIDELNGETVIEVEGLR